jgi:prepilin-type N-terminal cleavage/methylation domain-containing protein
MRMNNKGVTLIELIVATGIMSVLMMTATGMLVGATKYFEKETAAVELQNEAQIVTNYITECVMEATAMDFTVSDDKTQGTFKLYKEGSKEDQRILYFTSDGTNPGSLYMVTFQDDTEPAVYADEKYLLSDELMDFTVEVETATATDPTADPADPTAEPEMVVGNPVKLKIEFTIKHGVATSKFEITASCRNRLDKVTINGTEYKALDR